MNNMINKKTWGEFRKTGLLWFINSILHMFGWALCYAIDEDGKILEVYPGRCKYRGFAQKCNEEGYIQVSKYLQENIDELLREAIDE